jgi:hypothetical protein
MPLIDAEPYAFAFEPSAAALLIINMQRDFLEPVGCRSICHIKDGCGRSSARDLQPTRLNDPLEVRKETVGGLRRDACDAPKADERSLPRLSPRILYHAENAWRRGGFQAGAGFRGAVQTKESGLRT